MKQIFSVFLFLSASHAFACPDFSGTYQQETDDSHVELSFRQTGCESATVHTTEGEYSATLEMVFDGKLRPTFETDRVLFQESEIWQGEKLRVVEDFFWKSDGTRIYTVGDYYLNASGSLVYERDSFNGRNELQGHYVSVYSRK